MDAVEEMKFLLLRDGQVPNAPSEQNDDRAIYLKPCLVIFFSGATNIYFETLKTLKHTLKMERES